MKKNRSSIRFAMLVAGLMIAGLARADAVTDNAKALLDKGEAKAAYALLEPLEPQRAGDPEYDFLLGLAALEIGKNTNAVFALERVLAVDPNHARARAEIARAYAALGELATAKQEFETAKRQGVPAEVANTIDRLVAAIEPVEDKGRTTLRGFVEGTVGHDSNVNAATSDRSVSVPAFGGFVFPLAPGAYSRSDTFTTVAGGFGLRHPFSQEWSLTAGASASKRMNTDIDRFDTGSADAYLGMVRTYGKNVFSATLQYNQFWVDNDRYREAAGFTTQWRHNYSANTQTSLYIQYAGLHYMTQEVRNTDRFVIGANFAHALPGLKTVTYGGAYIGEEVETNGRFPQFGHRLVGARIGAQHEFRQNMTFFANLAYEHRNYGANDPLFLKTRNDNQWYAGLGMAWKPARDWVVTPQYQYTRTDSNLPLNEYSREVVSVTVRRNF